MDERYSYSIDESVEAPLEEDNWIDFGSEQPPETTEICTDKPLEPTETSTIEPPEPTPFIPEGQRAELFEMTDDTVATIRITIPIDELKELKEIANKEYCFRLPDRTVMPMNNLKGPSAYDEVDGAAIATAMTNAPPGFDSGEQIQFETKNAVMTFEINGDIFYL